MAAQDYANDYQSTITVNYSSGGGSLTVATTTGLPASGTLFVVKVDSEYFECTSYSGFVLTVVGAFGGSSASNHSNGATITGTWIIKEVLDGIRTDISKADIYANLPVSGMKTGDQFQCTDVPYKLIYDGAVWQPFYGTNKVVIPPAFSAWVNQGSATVTVNGAVSLACPADASNAYKLRTRSTPGSTFTLEAAFIPSTFAVNFPSAGIGLRESGTGKLIQIGFMSNGNAANVTNVTYSKYTDPTTFSSDVGLNATTMSINPFWVKIVRDSTNITTYFSNDGFNWVQFLQESKTAFFAGGADQLTFWINPRNATYGAAASLIHWYEH